jgi:hypothetical protein
MTRQRKHTRRGGTLQLSNAVNLMRLPEHKLVLMHTNSGRMEFYVIPGGPVSQRDAELIISRPDVQPFDSGLLPGHPQSWKLGAR